MKTESSDIARISIGRKDIKGEIFLSGSKSISNRVLLIRALCDTSFDIHNLSDSDDSKTLEQLLDSDAEILDAHHAGTTFRFLTAFLATGDKSVTLTGSERMKQRPIKALVDALNELGADIIYLENEGFPPIRINPAKTGLKSEISLPANISSQYITALLLIAPSLENGLTLHLEGEIVSRPYIEMTVSIMKFFGVEVRWEGQSLKVLPQKYVERDFYVEADWSAASYYYVLAGLSEQAEIVLHGLHAESLQGDSEIVKIGYKFGIESEFGDKKLKIVKKSGLSVPTHFEYNFIKVPDIAQSLSVLCAGLGIHSLFTGLQTLKIKETDRISALQNELSKTNVFLSKMPSKFSKKTKMEYYLQEGKAMSINEDSPVFETYNDHRMAMAFAPLALKFPVLIKDPRVVSKSYPDYWKHLSELGFDVEIPFI